MVKEGADSVKDISHFDKCGHRGRLRDPKSTLLLTIQNRH